MSICKQFSCREYRKYCVSCEDKVVTCNPTCRKCSRYFKKCTGSSSDDIVQEEQVEVE